MVSLKLFKKISTAIALGFFIGLPSITYADDITYGWAKGVGGAGTDFSVNMRVATSGNVYAVGLFSGTIDADPGPGVSNLTSTGGTDYFLTKFDSSGNFVWAKDFLATATTSRASYSISIDSSENIYLSGYFRLATDFDPGPGTTSITSVGGNDMYILKLDSSGNLVWVKTIGSGGHDFAYSVINDSSGNVYVTGGFTGTVDFDPGAGTANLTSAGGIDAFLLKLDSSGGYVWAKSIGGSGDDYGQSITRDTAGNFIIGGFFSNTADFDPDGGVFNMTSAGGRDAFVVKLDPSLTFIWAKSLGGTTNDVAQSIIVDPGTGDIYIKGEFSGTADLDPGLNTYNITSINATDIFLTKLDSSGSFMWAKSIAGVAFGSLWGSPIVLDAYGYLYVAGGFTNTVDFNRGNAEIQNKSSAGIDDIFLLKLNPSGGFVWVKTMGSTGEEGAYAVAVDSLNNLYLSGYYSSATDLDPGPVVATVNSIGGYDMFVARYNFLDTTPPVINLNGSGSVILFVGDPYVDQGATATDAVDGNLTGSIITTGSVDTITAGVYTITYSVTDTSGNSTTAVRTVNVRRQNYGHPTIPTPPVVLASPSVSSLGGQSKFFFTKTLSVGMRDTEVTELQKYLNAHGTPVALSGTGSAGHETNYFGRATKTALAKYQKAHGILPASGYFGSLTKKYINDSL